MTMINRLKMKYRYRGEWREKYVTLESIWKWMREGKYQTRVEAARNLRDPGTALSWQNGDLAEEELPIIYPTQGERGQYATAALCRFLCHHQFAGTTEGREWQPPLLGCRGQRCDRY